MKEYKTIFPEYLPPEGLSLLEIAVLLDNKLDYSDLSFQFFDFILKGVLSFDGKIITLVAGHEKVVALSEFELDLLNILFEDMRLQQINLADINNVPKNKLYAIRSLAYLNLAQTGYYAKSPMEQREKYFNRVRSLLMLCSFYLQFMVFFGVATMEKLWQKGFYGLGLLTWVLLFVFFILIPGVWIGIAYFMAIFTEKFSEKTTAGADLYARVLGFKEFIVTAEKGRIEYMVRTEPDTYYQALSFAYLFGVIRKWMPKNKNTQQLLFYQQFEDLDMFTKGSEDSFTRANSVAWIWYNLWSNFLPVMLYSLFRKHR